MEQSKSHLDCRFDVLIGVDCWRRAGRVNHDPRLVFADFEQNGETDSHRSTLRRH